MKVFLLTIFLLVATSAIQAQQTIFVPTCAGIDDTAAFQSLITGAAGSPRTIQIPYKSDLTKRCALNTIIIPANITIDNTNGSGIKVNSGQTLTVQGPIVNPVGKQIFFGTGTVSFSGNSVVGSNGQVLISNGAGVSSWSSVGGLAPSNVIGDAKITYDAAITSGSPTLTSVAASFALTDTGKTFCVVGAGVAGATKCVTGTFVNSTTITLASNASTSVSGARLVWGTENTSALQTALTAASVSANTTVSLLPGNYLFSTAGGITLPKGVVLQGSWQHSPRHIGYRFSDSAKPMDGLGSTLVIFSNEGTSTGQFALVNSSASVRGFSVFHPAQVDSFAAPKVYPFTVHLEGDNSAVEHCELVDPYQGVYSHMGVGQAVIDVIGQPILTGLYASHLYDTSHYEDISWVPDYTYFATIDATSGPISNLENWTNQNATVGFKLGRIDNFQGRADFVFGMRKGFNLVVDGNESTTYQGGAGATGGSAWGTCTGCGVDGILYAVDVENTSEPATGGLGFTFIGGSLNAVSGAPNPPPANRYCVITETATFTGTLRFVGMMFNGDANAVGLALGGSGYVGIANSDFSTLFQGEIDTADSIHLTISNNRFQRNGNNNVTVRNTVSGVSSGNYFTSSAANAFQRFNSNVTFSSQGDIFSDNQTWQTAALQNSWVALGGGTAAPGYILRGGMVCLRGSAKNGTLTAGTTIFTLPAGAIYRNPAGGVLVPVVQSNGGTAIIQIDTAAGIIATNTVASNASLSFDGVCFPVY